MIRIFGTILLLGLFTNAIAQVGKVSGQVQTADKTGLPSASVYLKGTNLGGTTDNNGRYEFLSVKEGAYTLVISFVGFNDKEVKIKVIAGRETKVPTIFLDEDQRKLNEVVVEADVNPYIRVEPSQGLRVRTEIAKLPQNVQVVSNELIKDQQAISMMEGITRNVSGAQMIEHWGHFARINMRGFKLPAFRNGMNVEMPWGPLAEDMSMVERIEFVKGPAGFMLSAGEPGGFYNVVTKKPTKRTIREVSATAGSFNTYRGTVDLGGKINPSGRLQYRLNGMYQTQESHRDFEESNRYSIAPALTYEISENTSLTSEFTYQQADMYVGAAYVFGPTERGFGSVGRNFTAIDSNFPKTDIKEWSVFTNFSHKFNENWRVEAQHAYVRYDQQGFSAWVSSVADNGDVLRTVGIWDALNNAQFAQLYVSGDVKTGVIRHKLLAGVDHSNKKYWADWNQAGVIDVNGPFNVFAPEYNISVLPEVDRSESVKTRGEGAYQGAEITGYYVQDEIGLAQERLRLTLAARYTDAKVFAYGNEVKNDKITPRFGASFDVIPSLTVYGLYDHSFIPQLGLSALGDNFEPEDAIDIEGGIKKSFFDGKVRASLGAFQITKENILVGDPENPNFSIQLGEVQSKGIEFDLQGQVTEQLNIVLNYANTNVEITEDTNPDNVGLRVAGHAKHITNGWFNYGFKDESLLKGFGISLGYQYQVDRSSWNWGADNESALPDYFRLDGAVSWRNSNFHVRLNVNNILDEYLYSGSSFSNYLYWQSEPGINGRLSVTYTF